ncbi:hypothetical protein AOLI_G00019180 [Acnodon oligacanthus]
MDTHDYTFQGLQASNFSKTHIEENVPSVYPRLVLQPQTSTSERLKPSSPRRFHLVTLLDWTWFPLFHSVLLSAVSAVHNAAEDKMANQPTEVQDRV